MNRLLFILAVSFGSIAAGYVLQRILSRLHMVRYETLTTVSSRLKLVALVILQPIAILNAFWRLNVVDLELLTLPILGVFSILIGALSALACIGGFKIPPYRAGSVLTSSMFTNIGVFAALIAFVLYGPTGFLVVQLFRVFEEPLYYAVGFPLSYQVSRGPIREIQLSPKLFAVKPVAIAPLGALIVGTLLRWFGLPAPDFLAAAADVIIPVMTAVLGFSIGITTRISRVADYRRELLMVVATKFVVIPAIIIPTAWFLGLGGIMDGVPLRVVAITSFMPTAFLALVPPAVYGFDLDLANSAWLVTTLSLIAIIPLLFLVLNW